MSSSGSGTGRRWFRSATGADSRSSRMLAERLGPLRERPELLATTRAYLANGMSARSLYVHQNTVPQRLRTIRRLLNRDLTDVVEMLDLIMPSA